MSNWIRVSLFSLSLGLASVATGCDKGGGATSKCAQNGTAVELSGNHGHSVDIPADAVKRGMGGTYAVKGTADHEHAVVLKDADMKKLQAGEPVTTRTSSVNGHLHEVSITCKQ